MNSLNFGVECITSKSNPNIVKISKLLEKKARKEEKLFIFEGVKLFEEAYNFNASIKTVVLNDTADFDNNIVEKIIACKKKGVQILCVSDSVFAKLTEEKAPQGIVCVCEFLKNHKYLEFAENVANEKIVVLESIRDPGNLGTIIRNSAAFGMDKLIITSDCADIYSSKVIRATMGAIFKTKIAIVSNLEKTLLNLKQDGRRVISLTLKENSLILGKDAITKSDVFVIGNEGHGISESVINLSTETMLIPMCAGTESLNAAIATTIIMWELFK